MPSVLADPDHPLDTPLRKTPFRKHRLLLLWPQLPGPLSITRANFLWTIVRDRFLSSAGAGGICARPMSLPDPSPVLDKNRAPIGPEILSSTGAGVRRKAPMAFPDSCSVLDTFQSAKLSVLQQKTKEMAKDLSLEWQMQSTEDDLANLQRYARNGDVATIARELQTLQQPGNSRDFATKSSLA